MAIQARSAKEDPAQPAGNQLNDAPPHRDRNGLRAVAGAELVRDVLHVNLDGLFGDRELLRDVAIPPRALAFRPRAPGGSP